VSSHRLHIIRSPLLSAPPSTELQNVGSSSVEYKLVVYQAHDDVVACRARQRNNGQSHCMAYCSRPTASNYDSQVLFGSPSLLQLRVLQTNPRSPASPLIAADHDESTQSNLSAKLGCLPSRSGLVIRFPRIRPRGSTNSCSVIVGRLCATRCSRRKPQTTTVIDRGQI
jgi:hypothetical protein